MGQARDSEDATVREEAVSQARQEAVSQARPELTRPRSPGISRVTLQDVANRAGVSLTTASRVVNEGARRVGPRLAERVNRAVTELGYTANLQARAVATGQSTMIGVVVHDIADPYFSSIAGGLIEAAAARHLLVCISSTSATEAAEREYVALMRAQRARAVILVGSRSDDARAREALRAEIAAFTRSGGRAVAVGQDLLGVDTILPENAAGAEALARAMVALGHRRFAVLAGPRGLLTARDRLDGFRAGLAAWSVPLEAARIVHGPFTRDGGYEAMSAVLAAEPLPDCVFAVTDVMAMGALARLRAGGLRVPADIALAGFDDILTLRDVYPPLTTVRLPLKRMGEMAAGLLLAEAPAAVADGDTGVVASADMTAGQQPRVIPVPGEVILRDSTVPRPPAR
jgi:LacI family transcriptional regulator, galactose operon repressor